MTNACISPICATGTCPPSGAMTATIGRSALHGTVAVTKPVAGCGVGLKTAMVPSGESGPSAPMVRSDWRTISSPISRTHS
jgi:hypothetical protein